jgi:hypothetical protein
MDYIKITFFLCTLFLSPLGVSADLPDKCSKFNNVALQFALAEKSMPAPLSLGDLETYFGQGVIGESYATSVYTWYYEKRMLVAKVNSGRIVGTYLSGKDDGSIISRKMEQAVVRLQSATSNIVISEIQKQLGPGSIVTEKMAKHTWSCGPGVIDLTTNQANSIIAATITYQVSPGETSIDIVLGTDHPAWDEQKEFFGRNYRSWIRTYKQD